MRLGVALKGDVDTCNKAIQTALMMAALFGRTAQIDMLLRAGAHPGLLDASGSIAASVGAQQGNGGLAAKLTCKAQP